MAVHLLALNKLTLYTLLVLFVMTGWACKKIEPNPAMGKKFERVIIENTSSYISLDTVINGFEWDEMCVKGPYTSNTYGELRSKINNVYQLDLSENDDTDGWNYLIFILRGRAVAYCKIPEGPCCSFHSNNWLNPIFLKKQEAIFTIGKEMYGSKIQYNLGPKPLSKPNSK